MTAASSKNREDEICEILTRKRKHNEPTQIILVPIFVIMLYSTIGVEIRDVNVFRRWLSILLFLLPCYFTTFMTCVMFSLKFTWSLILNKTVLWVQPVDKFNSFVTCTRFCVTDDTYRNRKAQVSFSAEIYVSLLWITSDGVTSQQLLQVITFLPRVK